MTEAPRPLPVLTVENEQYFTAAKHRKLVIQRCAKCERFTFYPRVACPYCFAVGSLEWVEATGRGKVLSYGFVHRPQHPVFLRDVPIPFVAVRLLEGPVMLSVVHTTKPGAIQVGMDVRVDFDEISDEISLPVWRPASEVAEIRV